MTNVMELAARISLDSTQFTNGLNNAKGALSTFGGAVKTGFSTVAKISGAALASTTAAATALTKSAVSAYGEYEQLIGGIDKLYGEASEKVQEYASEAYRTAGMSANEYLSNSTAFSAKLISDFEGDTIKAAEYADKAMRQIADNANTFGKYSVQDLTQVYQALARGSYMTLDNLNLGVSGTKKGMQELLDKAHELTGETYDIDNFADVIDAIGEVQTQLNITGTTAKEAGDTIQGSFGMAKSAWENLVVGLANPNADLKKLVKNFTNSSTAAFKNVLPIAKTSIEGIGEMVTDLMPEIVNDIPGIVGDVLPDMLKAGAELTGKLAKGFSAGLPSFVRVGKDVVKTLGRSIADNAPSILADLQDTADVFSEEIFDPLADYIINDLPQDINNWISLLEFSDVGAKLSEGITNGLDNFASFVDDIDWGEVGTKLAEGMNSIEWGEIVTAAAKAFATVIKQAPDLIASFAEALDGESMAVLVAAVFAPKLLSEVAALWISPACASGMTALQNALSSEISLGAPVAANAFGVNFIAALASFIGGYAIGTAIYKEWGDEIDEVLHPFFESVELGWQEYAKGWDFLEKNGEDARDHFDSDMEKLSEHWTMWQDSFNETMDDYTEGFRIIKNMFDIAREDASDFGSSFAETMNTWRDDMNTTYGQLGEKIFDAKEAVVNFWNESKDNWETGALLIWDKIDYIGAKWEDFKDSWAVGADEIHNKVIDIKNWFGSVGDKLENLAIDAYTWGSDLVNNFINGVNSLGDKWNKHWEDFGGTIADYIGFSEPDKGELADFHTFAPDMIDLFTQGITENAYKAENAVNAMLGNIKNSFASDVTSSYTPYSEIQGTSQAVSGAPSQITLQLVDGAYNVIAQGVASPLDLINGRRTATALRGR